MLSLAMNDQVFLDKYNLKILVNYRLLAPINIVIDKDEKTPYIYEYEWTDIIISKEGNSKFLSQLYSTTDHNGKIKKGWQDILEEICWHIQNCLW